MLIERKFPDVLAVLPSETYIFGEVGESRELDLRIICRRLLTNGVEVLAVNLGLLAFNFEHSKFGGFRRIEFLGSGQVHEQVSDNTDEMISLQLNRLKIATFVTACIYGIHAKRRHCSLERPLFPSLDDVYGWVEIPSKGLFLPEADTTRLKSYLYMRQRYLIDNKINFYIIPLDTVN